MSAPVLLLVFNRPEVTRRVFNAVREARPERLYVAADGPRPGVAGDAEACARTREVVSNVDWPCEVSTLFRERNLGCRSAVSQALDWFFAAEPEGIVLEDDCLPDASWFPFAAELLVRYREDERVCCVSGNHFHGAAHRPEASYFASIFNHVWGWASWRRAWRLYDDGMTHWPELRDSDWLLRLGQGDPRFARYWTAKFDACHRGEVDTWDYRWTYSVWRAGALSLLPNRNLVLNLGIGRESTHTRRRWRVLKHWRLESMRFPLTHPDRLEVDHAADRWTSRHVFRISLVHEWARRIAASGPVQWIRRRLRIRE